MGAFPAWGAAPPDKSGVKASVISLPSGAGSIEGLGESFEPQLNSGGSTYGVAIAVPPGRGGLVPSVRIDYNSYSGNGICGVGWSLDFMSVKRQTDKGFPEYSPADTFIYQGEELVPLSNAEGDWRCENERRFDRLRRLDTNGDGQPDAWEVTERNGTRHTLGRFRGANGRWSVVEHPEKGGQAPFDRTYCWMIDSTVDLHGNRIEYEYTQGPGVLYPSRISYSQLGSAVHEVIFEYESRPDAFDDYRPSFSSRLDRRLTRIEVKTQGARVRAYEFAYQYEAGDLLPDAAAGQAGLLDLGVTLLKRVVQLDRSGDRANFLPPLIFAYSGLDLTRAEQRSLLSTPDLDLAEPSGRVQLADLNGDGLPDLFATSAAGAGTVQQVCLNRGETAGPGVPTRLEFGTAMQVDPSSPLDLALPNTLVHDPKGKGVVDLSALVDDGPNKRLDTFANRAQLEVVDEARLGFSSSDVAVTVLENPPAFVSYSDAATRQMDVNFDKKGDFVKLEPAFGGMRVNSFFIGRSGRWTEGESVLPGTFSLANTFAGEDGQPNPCVHLADMNGDRLLDLLCLAVEAGGSSQRVSVSYWPLCGLGRYGSERRMASLPTDSFEIGTVDLRDILVEDFTGDGLSDVAVLDGTGATTQLILRVNIAGQEWSAPYVLSNLPRYEPRAASEPTVVRVADVNGNGSVEIIFRNTIPQDTWVYVELLPFGKPSLLTGIDNSLGKRTTIVYGTASEDEQRARISGHPWRAHAPMALQVVRQIRTSTGLDLNADGREDTAVAEFHYRDPYYDGFEREFRGFAFAERVDFGDDFVFDPALGVLNVTPGWDVARTPTGQVGGPSLVTRYRFHTGAPDQRDNDEYAGAPPAFRLVDELTSVAGREEEPLKGLQWIQETVDPVVLHSARDGGFDAGADRAWVATTAEASARLTPDDYIYARDVTDWTIRRLYRPAEPLPYLSDQDEDGIFEDYRSVPVAPIPAGRFADQSIVVPAGSGRSVSFAFSAETRRETHSANGLLSRDLGYPKHPPGRTRQRKDYDDYGNPTRHEEHGLDDPAVDDERFSVTTYAHGGNALSLWVVNKVDSQTVTDENGVFVARTIHHYDGEPLIGVAGRIQDRALLHRTLQFVDADRSLAASRSRYDRFGNVVEQIDPNGNRRLLEWDSVYQTYPIMETVVVGGGSADLAIKVEYNLGFGVVIRSTDFNRNITDYGYDSFARLVSIVKPGDSAEFPTLAFEYQPVDPIRGRAFSYGPSGTLTLGNVPLGSSSRVTTRQREIAGEPGEYITATYTDGTGWTLAAVEEGEAAGTWAATKVSGFGLRLQPLTEWLPFLVSSVTVPQFSTLWPSGRPPESDGVNPTVVARQLFQDPLGRPIRVLNPPETWGGNQTETAVWELPYRKMIHDEEDLRTGSAHQGTPHIQEFDGLGRQTATVEVVRIAETGDPGPETAWRTEFGYDLNDQLVRIRDSQNNVKVMVYDGLKRMTEMQDPDRGLLKFEYDDASNLRGTLDARGQRISYRYDGANRILAEDYLDAGGPGDDVEYFYDRPQPDLDLGDGSRGAANQLRGQLAYVRDRSGETHFSYDARSRKEWEIKRIPDAVHGLLVSFRTRFAYDSADRIQKLHYPDGDELIYQYNSRSQVNRIRGAALGDLVQTVSYRPSGQQGQIEYGNGIVTRHEYDPRIRLSRIHTSGSGLALMDFAYHFDGASNVERIVDRRELAGVPDAARRLNTQVFQYDNLYRLTRVEYPNSLGGDGGQVGYRYDRIGNMASQISDLAHQEQGVPLANVGRMESGGSGGTSGRGIRNAGDPPGPHALSRIVGAGSLREWIYDANGNMTEFDGLEAEWDIKDRLAGLQSEEIVAQYTYDYTDRRVTKRVTSRISGAAELDRGPPPSPVATHYINQYFEIREGGEIVKYVWNGAVRVARVTADLALARRIQHLRLQAGWNLVCFRVEGSWPVLDPAANPVLGAAAHWVPGVNGNGYEPLTRESRLTAGSVAWLYAREAGTLALEGGAGPNSGALEWAAGSHFVGNRFATPIRLAEGAFPANVWLGAYDPVAGGWSHRLPGEAGLLQDKARHPGPVAPGGAFWVRAEAPGVVQIPHLAGTVRYYHQDHLGSSSVMTDRSGARVQELAFFPFGALRTESLEFGDSPDPYQFTQKERDEESGLQYFEARYLASQAGRFLNTDPKFTRFVGHLGFDWAALIASPQRLNLYAYSINNPIRYIDPTGLSEEDQTNSPDDADFGYWNGNDISSSGDSSSSDVHQSSLADNFATIDTGFDVAGLGVDATQRLAGTAGKLAGVAGNIVSVAAVGKDAFKLGVAIRSGTPDDVRDAGLSLSWGATKAALTLWAPPVGIAVQVIDLMISNTSNRPDNTGPYRTLHP